MGKTQLSEKCISTQVCLWLLVFWPVLPLLNSTRLPPNVFFISECIAIFVALLIGLFALPSLYRAGDIQVPRIVLLPAGLMLILVVQMQVLPQLVIEHAEMGFLYLFWVILIMTFVFSLKNQLGIQRIAFYLAIGLLLASVYSASLEVYERLYQLPESWGNIAQANNYGDFLALGFASGLYLLTRHQAKKEYYYAAMALIVLGLSLTASRSVWLYWFAMIVITSLCLTKQRRIVVVGLVLYVIFQILWANDFLFSAATSTEKMYHASSGISVRGHIWQVAWQIFTQSPWLGGGFGQFDWDYFNAGMHIPNVRTRMEHAHNLILHLLAEMGVFSVLILVSMLAVWVRGVVKKVTVTNEREGAVWLLMLVAILGIHSLLEYPLWYATLLGIAASILALGETKSYRLRLSGVSASALALLLVVALGVTAIHTWQYKQLQLALFDNKEVSKKKKEAHFFSITQKIPLYAPLLTPYVTGVLALLSKPEDKAIRQDLTLLTQANYQFRAQKVMVYLYVEMLALTGKREAAEVLMKKTMLAYSGGEEAYLKMLEGLDAEDRKKIEFLKEIVSK